MNEGILVERMIKQSEEQDSKNNYKRDESVSDSNAGNLLGFDHSN